MNFSDYKAFAILEALYEAPLEPSRWTDFLRLTAEAAGGHAAALLTHDANRSQSAINVDWGFDPEVAKLYAAHYGAIDIYRLEVTRSPDWLGTSEQYVPVEKLRKSEFYNDLLEPFSIPHAMFTMVESAPGHVANLSICRNAAAGPFDTPDLEILQFLKPHVGRAYRLHCEFNQARNTSANLLAALNALTTGVVLLGPKMLVLLLNRAAEGIIAAQNGLRIIHRQLVADQPPESARLAEMIADVVRTSRGEGAGSGGYLRISRRERPPLQVFVAPIRGISASVEASAIAFVTDPLCVPRPPATVLAALFRLTPAECRVAILLNDGHSARQIAGLLGLSDHTIRSQIKSIFSKTGVRRQSELVRLLLSIASPTV